MVKIILDKSAQLQTVMDAGRHIHEAFNALDVMVANRMGVQRNDLRCLLLLKYGPVTPGEVAARTGLTSGSVTALLDRLESAGHVERQRSVADRRSIEVALTACSQAQMQAVQVRIEAVIRRYFGSRSTAEITAAGDALEMFAEALDHCTSGFDCAFNADDQSG